MKPCLAIEAGLGEVLFGGEEIGGDLLYHLHGHHGPMYRNDNELAYGPIRTVIIHAATVSGIYGRGMKVAAAGLPWVLRTVAIQCGEHRSVSRLTPSSCSLGHVILLWLVTRLGLNSALIECRWVYGGKFHAIHRQPACRHVQHIMDTIAFVP